MRIRVLDLATSGQHELDQLTEVLIRCQEHDRPDRPATREQVLGRLRHPLPGYRPAYWLALDGDTAVGVARLKLTPAGGAVPPQLTVSVRPERRRHGGGTTLLREAVRLLWSAHRPLVVGNVHAGSPAAHFADAMGLRIDEQLSEATIAVTGRPIVARGARDYEFAPAPAVVPADLYTEIAALPDAGTPGRPPADADRLASTDEVHARRGFDVVRVIARPTTGADAGTIVGYVEAVCPRGDLGGNAEHAVQTAIQTAVVVSPEHRRRGVGTALVAAVLEQLAAGYPHVRALSARLPTRADSREFGRLIGYRPQHTWQRREGDVAKLAAHLGMTA